MAGVALSSAAVLVTELEEGEIEDEGDGAAGKPQVLPKPQPESPKTAMRVNAASGPVTEKMTWKEACQGNADFD